MSQANAPQIIAAWRAAERRLATLEPGTAAHAEAAGEVERLRREYQKALDAMKPPARPGGGR